MTWPRPFRGIADRFGIRLGLILTMALAPVGIIALVQSAGIGAEVLARTRAALAGETLRASAAPLGRITDAQGVARGLAAALPALSPAACTPVLRDLVGPETHYVFAALYGIDGRVRCAAGLDLGDVSKRPFFADYAADPRPMLRMVRSDPENPPNLLVSIEPVTETDGTTAGFVVVAPLQGRMFRTPDASRDFGVLLFDRNGNVLSANTTLEIVSQLVPRDRELKALFGQPEELFSAASIGGPMRLYSLSALIPDEIYALGTWRDQDGSMHSLSPLFLPAAMWAVCLLAAWVAAELMVTRHMRRFRRAITAFAEGNRRLRPLNLTRAPREIRDAADAFTHLTETILKDEADLENSVREKEALLREVHHRVKNNLQLMASIINLQLRRTRSDEAKGVMRRLQDRMLSLATIHNSLFHTANLTEVQAAPLLAGIVDQIIVSGAGAGQRFDIDASFDPVTLSPEQIVPLALLITEALGRAMSVAGSDGSGLPKISVALTHGPDGSVTLRVTNQIAAEDDDDEQGHDDAALGNQLIHAFALQLGGVYQRDLDASRQVQKLEFQQRPMGMIPPGPIPQG